jgi:hypothetical protein
MILGIFLLLSSCSPQKFCAKRFPAKVDTITKVDTVWTERFVKVGYPADSVDIFVPQIEIDRSQGKPIIKVKKSKQATTTLTIDSTGVKSVAHCAEKDSIIKILQAQINQKTQVTSVQHIPVEKPLKWYDKIARYLSIIFVTLILVKIGRLISKLTA